MMYKQLLHERRQRRVRSRITGTFERPRLCVRKTLIGLYGQIIDDTSGKTLAWADWREIDKKKFASHNVSRAHALGLLLAQKAKKVNIEKIVFDRGGYAYHGKVKAFSEGAREGGLQF
ncbi:MAG: 50S ribosomal protein L18 [Candidatus Moranbacteria bacterium]|nr:50S ribosomal protein L18 [Candidatus Moranbacteria bacterium]